MILLVKEGLGKPILTSFEHPYVFAILGFFSQCHMVTLQLITCYCFLRMPLLCLQISFSVWRRAMAGFWWVTVVYSILVLVTIYTYQFKAFPTYWKRVTHLDDAELKALGLEQHNTSGLFTKLLTPTLFVLVCNIQLHYFHAPLLQMTRITNAELVVYRGGRFDKK